MNQKRLILLLLLTFTAIGNQCIALANPDVTVKEIAGNKAWQQTGINNFDLPIIHFFQQFSQKSKTFDESIAFFAGSHLIKGGIIIAIWWFWFLPLSPETINRRVMVILSLIAGFVALLIGRILVITLPYRIRPMNSPELHLTIPFGANFDGLAKMSSFPSDHAALFFALSTGLFLASKRLGLFAFLYTIFFISLTRIYLCYHFPSDVLAGAIIGIAAGYFVCTNNWMQKLAKNIYSFSEQKPQFFYPAFFLLNYQLIDLFNEIRDIAWFFMHHFIHQL